jgi:hypothetical protein
MEPLRWEVVVSLESALIAALQQVQRIKTQFMVPPPVPMAPTAVGPAQGFICTGCGRAAMWRPEAQRYTCVPCKRWF